MEHGRHSGLEAALNIGVFAEELGEVGNAKNGFNVGGGDRDGDAGGEADDNRVGDQFGVFSQTKKSHRHQNDAGDDRHQHKKAVSVGQRAAARFAIFADKTGDDGNKGGGGAVDLIFRAAEGAADHAGEGAGDDALFWPQPHGHRKAHRHGDRR